MKQIDKKRDGESVPELKSQTGLWSRSGIHTETKSKTVGVRTAYKGRKSGKRERGQVASGQKILGFGGPGIHACRESIWAK